jgi:hypothetical protein
MQPSTGGCAAPGIAAFIAGSSVNPAEHQGSRSSGFKPNDADFDGGSWTTTTESSGAPGKRAPGSRRICVGLCSSASRRFQIRRCPFVNLPGGKTGHWREGITVDEMETLQWFKPMQVVKVSFTEWTRDGNLRDAAFLGVRTDSRHETFAVSRSPVSEITRAFEPDSLCVKSRR